MFRLFNSANSASGNSSTAASVMINTARFWFKPRPTAASSRSKCFTISCSGRTILVSPSAGMIRTLSRGTTIALSSRWVITYGASQTWK